MDSTDRNEGTKEVGAGGVSRLFALLRTLGEVPEGGERVTQLAQQVGLSQPTTHRLLRRGKAAYAVGYLVTQAAHRLRH